MKLYYHKSSSASLRVTIYLNYRQVPESIVELVSTGLRIDERGIPNLISLHVSLHFSSNHESVAFRLTNPLTAEILVIPSSKGANIEDNSSPISIGDFFKVRERE